MHNLAQVNVVLGKNGCGKSFLLKTLSRGMKTEPFGTVRYVALNAAVLLNRLLMSLIKCL